MQARPSEQSSDIRFLAPEPLIKFHRMFCSTLLKNMLTELLRDVAVENPRGLEKFESVRIENFGPFVRVVASRLTAGENVGE